MQLGAAALLVLDGAGGMDGEQGMSGFRLGQGKPLGTARDFRAQLLRGDASQRMQPPARISVEADDDDQEHRGCRQQINAELPRSERHGCSLAGAGRARLQIAQLIIANLQFSITRYAILLGDFFFWRAVAAQDLRQILREGRARHNRITTGLLRLQFQIALHVGDKSQYRGSLLEAGTKFRNGSQRFGAGVVQVEDDERRLGIFPATDLFFYLLGALDKLHAHIQFARGLVDLADEEKIFHESEDAHRIVAANDRFQHRLHGMTRGKLRRLAKGTKASASKALLPAIPTRRLHQVAVDFPISLLAITVIHGPGKYTGSLIALLAAMRRLATAVALLSLSLSLSRAFWASAVTARPAAAAAIASASLASLMIALLAVGSLRRRRRSARFGSG